jgi:RNA polymerase sigma-B factor
VGEEGGATLGDSMGEADQGFELADLRLTLGAALEGLTARERRIIMLRFYGNQTQTQIAEQVGVSQMHVSRLLTKALTKLRDRLDDA